MAAVSDEMRTPGTPDDVEVRAAPREPVSDPTLGVALPEEARGRGRGRPRHRLVLIGDSLTHGFQSGAVFHTDLSYGAIAAHELGWGGSFRFPSYPGHGGIPLNIELLLRDLEGRFGTKVDWWEVPMALFRARQLMDEIEDYWERGAGAATPGVAGVNHALAVYGWDLRDALERTWTASLAEIERPKDDRIHQVVEDNGARAALRVLPSVPAERRSLTVFGAAAALGKDVGDDPDDDPDHGIETLVVFLGSNNALQSVTNLKVVWSADGYDDLRRKNRFTVWRPTHFAAELGVVTAQVRQVAARHVVWCTVPHVTIAPIARGVATKVEPGSRYFPYYTRPWISDREFNPRQDPHITSQQARAVDSAIDQYNDAIAATVRTARQEGLDWYLLDTAGLLDRLASRRYLEDPLTRPDWWQPYPLPPELLALDPVPDTRFLASDGRRRTAGGLFSLDGVHPTTVGYGIVAQELATLMRRAGVTFHLPDGVTPRPDPVRVDFARLIRRDTLLTHPPGNVTSGLGILRWADEALDLTRRVLPWRG